MQLTAQELETLRTLEENLWRVEFRCNRAWTEAIFAADFFEFGRSGRHYTRAECLDIKIEAIDVVFPFEQFQGRLLAHDIAQLTYVSVEDKMIRANRSSLWQRTAGGWELTFHQGTPI